jgi:hypothetical protein
MQDCLEDNFRELSGVASSAEIIFGLGRFGSSGIQLLSWLCPVEDAASVGYATNEDPGKKRGYWLEQLVVRQHKYDAGFQYQEFPL